MQSLTAFLDTSVILSGLSSPSGGSRKLFKAAKAKKLKLVATVNIIAEVGEHLAKLNIEESTLHKLLSNKIILVLANPSNEFIEKFSRVTNDPDDAHVVAGTVGSGADVFISLDKKHILTEYVRKVLKPIRVISPKEFWHWVKKKKYQKFVV